MPALDPVSPYLTLIDRLISLVQARKIRRRDYFDKIVDPLYATFTPLAEDTLKLFAVAQRVADAHASKRNKKIIELKAKRDEFAVSRIRLRALLKATCIDSEKRRDEELTAFISSMLSFFSPIVYGRSTSVGRELISLFDLKDNIEAEVLPPYRIRVIDLEDWEVNNYIKATRAMLEASWFEISGRYMQLKLSYTVD